VASPQPASSRLEAANQAQSAQLRLAMVGALLTLWRGLGSWRETDIERFVRLAMPVLRASQQRMTALTAAYLSRQVALLLREPVKLAAVAPPLNVRGIPLLEEYGRPFHDVWSALHDGKPLTEALQVGERRLESLATTDLQLAKTHTSRQILASNDNVVGYRRVLEGPHSCGLCVLASTQRYHAGDLMPIHPGCDCSVAPIIGSHDPGRVIDADRLAAAHQAIAERFGATSAAGAGSGSLPDYRDLLVVHHHGEIGPVLAVRGQAFTGPAAMR
jgi:hypothetical protein